MKGLVITASYMGPAADEVTVPGTFTYSTSREAVNPEMEARNGTLFGNRV